MNSKLRNHTLFLITLLYGFVVCNPVFPTAHLPETTTSKAIYYEHATTVTPHLQVQEVFLSFSGNNLPFSYTNEVENYATYLHIKNILHLLNYKQYIFYEELFLINFRKTLLLFPFHFFH